MQARDLKCSPGTGNAARDLENPGSGNAARDSEMQPGTCAPRGCKGAGFRVISFYYVEEE